jgi:polysaccharide export outer membrane protein
MAASNPPALTPADYPALLIGPGDLISITVVGYQSHSSMAESGSGFSNNSSVDLPTDYMVDSDGEILFPFIGAVALAGSSQVEASQLLAKKLSAYLRYPQVTVLIKSTNSYNVSVLGEVTKPGEYLIRGQATFLSSISEAGGPIEDADLGGAILIHHGQKTKLDLGKFLLNNNYGEVDPYVYPGDIIMVPKSGWPNAAEWAIIASIISSGVIVFSVLHK